MIRLTHKMCLLFDEFRQIFFDEITTCLRVSWRFSDMTEIQSTIYLTNKSIFKMIKRGGV